MPEVKLPVILVEDGTVVEENLRLAGVSRETAMQALIPLEVHARASWTWQMGSRKESRRQWRQMRKVGSNFSLSQSPRKLVPSTVRRIAKPGTVETHHARLT